MKKMRRFAAIAAAAAMTACMAVPMMSMMSASAVQNYVTFTGETKGTHTYTAYQIFKGDAEASGFGDKVELKNLDWAMDKTKAESFLKALQDDETLGTTFDNCKTPADVVGVLTTYESNKENARKFAAAAVKYKEYLVAYDEVTSEEVEAGATAGTIKLENDGYYVIEETAFEGDTADGASDGAKTLYLLGVYDSKTGADITVKSSIPTVEKKIKENVKTGNWSGETYGAGYNDTADFSIGDTVPFKLIGTIPSTISDYDTYQYVFHDTLGKEFTVDTTNFAPVVKVGTATLTPTSATAVKQNDGKTIITVDFDDIKAAAKTAGVTFTKDTKVEVTYNATLNENAVIGQPGQVNEVYLEYSNNPNNGGDGTSHTKVDKVIAFTYELDVTKVDGANNAIKLAGAEFKLKAVDGENAGKWAKVDTTTNRVTGWAETEADATILTSGSDGVFKVLGLDDGAYSLKETKAPGIYNILSDPIEFTIDAETNNTQTDNAIDGTELSAIKITVGDEEPKDGTAATGIVTMDVENNSGASLPSTGGIGTTLFYVIGGTMAAGAGVALIAKKRMKNEE